MFGFSCSGIEQGKLDGKWGFLALGFLFLEEGENPFEEGSFQGQSSLLVPRGPRTGPAVLRRLV
jgi:hypothetical protein